MGWIESLIRGLAYAAKLIFGRDTPEKTTVDDPGPARGVARPYDDLLDELRADARSSRRN